MFDWILSLIGKAYDEPTVREKESQWQYKHDTFLPSGLSERERVDLGSFYKFLTKIMVIGY